MDSYRLVEVATEIKTDYAFQRLKDRMELLESRIEDLITLLIPMRLERIEQRLEKTEQRLDLMMALKTKNNIDLSKFTCEIIPLNTTSS